MVYLKQMSKTLLRAVAVFLTVVLFLACPRDLLPLMAAPLPHRVTPLTSAAFEAPALKGLILDPQDPLRFHFILDDGDVRLDDSAVARQAQVLLDYFLAALALPEKDIWVNLSPYESDNIVPDKLANTQMGRDLLAQDYILKQLAASLTHPDTDNGKRYWQMINNQAGGLRRGGAKATESAASPNGGAAQAGAGAGSSFTKVWIVPEKAVVYQDKDRVYIGQSRLKVLTEEDYLAMSRNRDSPHFGKPEIGTVPVNAFKAHILPLIEKEVNEGKNFAQLRQIYHSLILAMWFKKALKQSALYGAYADKGKTKGIDNVSLSERDKIYDQYVAAFKKGAYDIVKKIGDCPRMGTVPISGRAVKRRYFSGGFAVPEEFAKDGMEERPLEAMPQESGSRVVTAQAREGLSQPQQEQEGGSQKRSISIEVNGGDKVTFAMDDDGKLDLALLWQHYNKSRGRAGYNARIAISSALLHANGIDLSVDDAIACADNVLLFQYLLFLSGRGLLNNKFRAGKRSFRSL